MSELTTLKRAMNYDWAFLPMTVSNDLLPDPNALQRRLAEDGYLYFSQVIDRDKVLRLRRRMLTTLRDCGWIDGEAVLMRGRVAHPPVREGTPEFLAAYDEIQKLEEFHTLAHDEQLMSIMRGLLGESAFPHPLKIARLIFPDHYEVSTPPHQDYPNNQGTPKLTATWIPVGDLPSEMGGLAILRGSHHWGMLPLTTHLGAGNRCAVLPRELLEQCRWVTTEFSAGDVLVFSSLTVHAARHNASEFFMRLSVDFRYQPEREPLTSGCLQPHFARLTWDEIYEGWSTTDQQYYWHDLDFDIVPFEELDLVNADTHDAVAEFLPYENRVAARVDRRRERAELSSGPLGR